MNFKKFLETKYVSSAYLGGEVIDLNSEPYFSLIVNRNVAELEKILRGFKRDRYNLKAIKCYHATSVSNMENILENGLLATSNSRKRTLSSSSGYVYLSIYPDSAKTFGSLGYPYEDIVLFELEIPVDLIIPDSDQIFLYNRETGLGIENTVA